MISFDLKCGGSHVFEAWFRSSADYEAQRKAGQIACPVCGDPQVGKAVMAPAVAAKGNQRATLPMAMPEGGEGGGPDPAQIKALIQAIAQAQAEALKSSMWVGDDFATRARAMHYGEADHAPIHGRANLREARELLEEGLPVAPLLVPIAPPDQTN